MIVKVAFPIALSGMFDYSVPEKFISSMSIGIPVKVELRNRYIWGIVIEIAETSPFPRLKKVIEIKSEKWNYSSRSLIELYSWISKYYQSELGTVFKPFLRKKIVDKKPKTVMMYSYSGTISNGLTEKQMLCAEKCRQIKKSFTKNELINNLKLSNHMITKLISKKVLFKNPQRIFRHAPECNQEISKKPVILSHEQETSLQQIWNLYHTNRKPVLLYGITGSGKTYVYIELVKRIISIDKNVIILVPEISLTPQTIKRFKNSINCDIAVIHSRMSDGERRDTIENIMCKKIRIVIGVRSAILAPLDNIGLIIVDEEHDGSYKQSDPEPRYNSRDVAVIRGKFQNALVLLGSATPSFESYYNALNNKYALIELTQRYGKATLPRVQIVDMTQEYKHNNYTFISRLLKRKMYETLANKKQIILFINRRGFSVCLICRDCGFIYECSNCSVKLIYHKSSYTLRCHQCGYSSPVPEKCISCGGEQIQYKGTGIQKVEEYLKVLFKEARIIRMDQDTMRKKGSHLLLYDTFLDGKADILLGTQMISKGLNFPDVRLVGVLQADIGLHFPDFRASEKTFQLLTQVAGRAGRKDDLGEVIIQTYSPQEPGVQYAKSHDFVSFYKEETKSRFHLGYPPFSRLARIIIQGEQEKEVSSYISNIAQFLIKNYGNFFIFLGPTPAILTKIKKLYRYSLLIKSKHSKQLEYALATIKRKYKNPGSKMKLIIDVDPYNML